MSERSPRFVWMERVCEEVRVGAIDSRANLVAHIMAAHYVNGSCEAWPSQPELVAATGLSPSTVRRALHDLETNGLLGVTRGASGRTSGNVYTLLLGGNGSSGG